MKKKSMDKLNFCLQRQNQTWQDEDAAWEAFLDQTDTKETNKTSMPSMVCSTQVTYFFYKNVPYKHTRLNGPREHYKDSLNFDIFIKETFDLTQIYQFMKTFIIFNDSPFNYENNLLK